jgi:AAA domain
MTTPLLPNRDMLTKFVASLFRHAGTEGFVSLRAFFEDDAAKPFRITPTSMKGGLSFLIGAVEDDAYRAANDPKKVVFCPPLAIFDNRDRAREIDIIAGLALSVECDQRPREAVVKLEEILGPATLVVRSGGVWTDPANGQVYDKLHLHWRLRVPACGEDRAKLKRARDLATRLVGGDASNTPVCHPIRWPGSWHRKGEPRLCEIESENEHEIDLAAALTALERVTPAVSAPNKTNGGCALDGLFDQAEPSDWSELIAHIVNGTSYHEPQAKLASKMVRSGMTDGAVVNMLRAIFESTAAARDARWQARYDDISRSVTTAREKYGSQEPSLPAPTGPLIKSSKQFVEGFTPPDYVVVGLVQRRFLYSLTGQTGSGKTAVTLRLAASTAMGIDFAGRTTKKTRVLYAAAENPDDVRMRWIALAQHMGFDLDTIEVYFTEGCFSISQMTAKLRAEAEALGGEFGLVIVDTSPAFFEGDDENSRAQMGAHARKLRGLINIIPGGPAVIANCHPVKNATAENLLPAGGGTFINEMDGNLTCAKSESVTEMHWQGKFRGPEFAPMNFIIKTVTHQDIKDSDGRLIPTVICEHLSEHAKEEITAAVQG